MLQLTCFACGKAHDPNVRQGLCDCGKPLRVDLEMAHLSREERTFTSVQGLDGRFPCRTLGEGETPLLPYGRHWIKDEGLNPTGSFKARGMAMAVYKAASFGVTKLAVPSAGNAGGALAAYAALYGLEAHVFMPIDVPRANRLECELYGAKVTLVDGLITDCAKRVMDGQASEGWFDVSTLKEPYRIEGKKTMGYEIVAQLGWKYPDWIFYPTGGGTGLIGMWKAFEEMEALGWVTGSRPKMVSVQAEGCAPIVRQWEARAGSPFGPKAEKAANVVRQEPRTHPFLSSVKESVPHTVAAGLRVPRALGDFIILDILEKSGGLAVSVSDAELIRAARRLSRETGICVCPEGGAALAALEKLQESGQVGADETAVLFNTGTGLKYEEAFAAYAD